MKTFIYLIAGIFLLSFARRHDKQNFNDWKGLLKSQTVKISDSSLMSKYEVSNKLYNLFLADLRKQDPSGYGLAKVDSLKWNEQPVKNDGMVKNYNSHPAYSEFPVVNISHEAAVMFCTWLKKKYMADAKEKIKDLRLPSAAEWEAAAAGNSPNAVYSWPGSDLFDKSGQPYGQYKGSSEAMTKPGKLNDSWEETAPVNSYKPNTLGLYNMCGNVAEMTSEKGHTKGGAWNSSSEQLKIHGYDEFSGFSEPSPYIGFRYVVILDK